MVAVRPRRQESTDMVEPRARTRGRPAVATVLVFAAVGLSACADEDDDARAPFREPAVPDIRGAEDLDDPYVGLLDAAFREDLEAYSGQEVTLLADVADVISPRAFTVTSPTATTWSRCPSSPPLTPGTSIRRPATRW
ncbi:hypothetical protein [Blastococcus brunescens]|uniref:Uncharacterized protein n=1 Tax=Blastococcus brunescens TaxID=1564165 RepID=A0ABZ1B6D1_9ACTN|nr:hypothetical protein [Blastococcus sp. BMG 8361]WRL66372.1 hypothetical protein U6N30_13590 [Blastococcus sp. BMG 8361]